MCQIFCCSIIQGVSFNYHLRNVRSRVSVSNSRSRSLLLWQSLSLEIWARSRSRRLRSRLHHCKIHIRSTTKFHVCCRHEGVFCWLTPPKKLQALPNWNNKHYKSGVFVKILDVKHPCPTVKTLIEDILTTVLKSSMKDRKKLVVHRRSTFIRVWTSSYLCLDVELRAVE